jgi:lysozyme family protein|tara:strand:+ start:194 stop:505 length:312 start_codon:yes stop_codon:yes gene_type:complete
MAIIDTITLSTFRDHFYRREQYKNNFSYEGLETLYNYLWELSEDTGEDIEMDIVAFSCEFAEYNSIEEFQEDYSREYETIEDIEEQTTVIKLKNKTSFIIRQF